MADKKQKSEPEFIRGTVLASILLLLIFIAAGVVFARNPDAVRGAAVRTLSSLGNFSAAAELAGDMDGDEAQAQSLYHVAEKMLSGGSFEEAAELFKSLGEYSDSAAKYLEAEYAYADALYNDGSYERAMEVFSAVSAYGDAAERQKACVYAMAAEAYEGGEYLRASTLFAGLSSYEDVQERAFDAALRITGDADAAAVIVSSGGLSAEAAEKAADIAMLRSSCLSCPSARAAMQRSMPTADLSRAYWETRSGRTSCRRISRRGRCLRWTGTGTSAPASSARATALSFP